MSDSAGVGRTKWMSRGPACRYAEPELFFPATTGATAAGQTEKAKAVCACCPVRTACLAYALATQQQYGVWGGATDKERRAMIRALYRAAAARTDRDVAAEGSPAGVWRLRHLRPRLPSE